MRWNDGENVVKPTVGKEGNLRRLIVTRMQYVKVTDYKDEQEYTQTNDQPARDSPPRDFLLVNNYRTRS